MGTIPNLFDYATSELSQDAFLCWWIAHADCDERPSLKLAAQKFIAFMWTAAKKGATVERPESITLTRRSERQRERIDILFEANVGATKAVFIIEDKTDTSHHSGQLQEYIVIARRTYPDREIVGIYFKTGFLFGLDEEARVHGYAVIGLREIVDFMEQQSVASEIFSDYLKRAKHMLAEREATLAMLRTPGGYRAFVHDYVQYTFITDLAAQCDANIGGIKINRGRSIGGAPWTHLRFAEFKSAYSGLGEVLFHRIDARKNKNGYHTFYLSTRQYSVVRENAVARAEKRAKLKTYRKLFDDAYADVGSLLSLEKAATDNTGANESEIGVLFFDDMKNSVESVLWGFPAIHAAFVARVQQTFVT